MAKVNKALAAKKARDVGLYFNGCLDGDYYRPQYQQGHEAYLNATPKSNCWHPHKIQGWNHALEADIKFVQQLKAWELSPKGKPVSDATFERIMKRMTVAAEAA